MLYKAKILINRAYILDTNLTYDDLDCGRNRI